MFFCSETCPPFNIYRHGQLVPFTGPFLPGCGLSYSLLLEFSQHVWGNDISRLLDQRGRDLVFEHFGEGRVFFEDALPHYVVALKDEKEEHFMFPALQIGEKRRVSLISRTGELYRNVHRLIPVILPHFRYL